MLLKTRECFFFRNGWVVVFRGKGILNELVVYKGRSNSFKNECSVF